MAACMDARRRHRADRRTRHAVGTRPSIPPPSPTGRNRAPCAKDPRTLRVSTHRGEIGREATAAGSVTQPGEKPTTGKSVGKPGPKHKPEAHMRTLPRGKSVGEPGKPE